HPDDSAPTREFLEIIRKNTVRMARLTEDLLTLARVESGETRFETEPVPPAELLHDAEESFREILDWPAPNAIEHICQPSADRSDQPEARTGASVIPHRCGTEGGHLPSQSSIETSDHK
ncbi:MAG: cell wall metabolism sensor histidine kinase WalK, partial [Acidobacteriia bacterium]|nr:cell wall metabolism sensor histidine kinase WalK [Terriglobia bacterium]